MEGPTTGEPPQGLTGTWEQAKVGGDGGGTQAGNGGRCRHVSWDAEKSGGGWQGAVTADIHLYRKVGGDKVKEKGAKAANAADRGR